MKTANVQRSGRDYGFYSVSGNRNLLLTNHNREILSQYQSVQISLYHSRERIFS